MVVRRDIDLEDYCKCLFDRETEICEQNSIRSRLHVVRTERQSKMALSPHDDKRYVLPNTTDTLAWGHYAAFLEDGDTELLSAAAAAAVIDEVGIDDEVEVNEKVGIAPYKELGIGFDSSLSDEQTELSKENQAAAVVVKRKVEESGVKSN